MSRFRGGLGNPNLRDIEGSLNTSASTPGSHPPLPPSLAPGAPAVLIVEPLPDQQWKLARMFTVQGYRVIGSASVMAARALLRRFPVDLIMLAEDDNQRLTADVTDLRVQAPNAQVVVMGVSEEAQQLAAAYEGVVCVQRPNRMQDLSALQAAVA